MADLTGAPNTCAPQRPNWPTQPYPDVICGPVRPVYRPQDRVTYLLPPRPPLFGSAEVAPEPDVFLVIGVIREETLHGLSVSYRLDADAGRRVVDAALVVRVDPPAAGGPVCDTATCAAPAGDRGHGSPDDPDAALAWKRISPRVEVSADGRFEIEEGQAERTARDVWTGEVARPFPFAPAARDWCECRRDGNSLNWVADGTGGYFAKTRKGERFEVHLTTELDWAAIDGRFACRPGGPDHPLRSARLGEIAAARRWCEVRAACAVEGTGMDATLKYTCPIPF